MTFVPLLAHAAEGHVWQAMTVVFALGLVVVAAMVLVGRLSLERLDDLVLPLAGVTIASSLAPLASTVLSDWVGWALPMGGALLAALLLAAGTRLELRLASPLTISAVGGAVVGVLLLHQPITAAWHPAPELLPSADDVELVVVSPVDGATVPAGELEVRVELEGGSVGPAGFTLGQAQAADPEEAGTLVVSLDGERRDVRYLRPCTIEAPCTVVSFVLDGVEPGQRVLRVEFTRGDGMPFAPQISEVRTFTVR